jgi:biotin synthase
MCYAIPGRIVSISGKRVSLDYFGEEKEASILFNPGNRELVTGNYVYAQGGIVVDRIDSKEAEEILKIWKEKFFELKKKDEKLQSGFAKGELGEILNKVQSQEPLKFNEIKRILDTGDSELETLYENANKIRSESISNSCCVHGIIEFSNHCTNSCKYCGINCENKKLKRYRMSVDEIIAQVDYAVSELGFKALVLQSGEDAHYTDEVLVDLVKKIREKHGILIFMSIGERSFECYKRLYEVGAYGALLRFETSNAILYEAMHSGRKLAPRLKLVKQLIAHGFIVATGFILGLPGATQQDLVNDILLTKSLKPEMYSFGPLIPHPDTPLKETKGMAMDDALKAIATCRLVDPNSHILITTALETLDPSGKRKGLLAGGNSLMINVTPEEYRDDYEIYPDKAGNKSMIKDTIKETLDLLYSLGRAPTDLGL